MKDELMRDLAEQLRHRREGCPILYAVELDSAVQAIGLTQAEIDEVVAMSELSE